MQKFSLLFILIIISYSYSSAQISINSFTFHYSQNFNTLASVGTGNAWTDNSTILGWYSTRTLYNAGTGSSTTGALYSFGSTGSSERALGSVASGTTETINYGVRFVNNSDSVITRIPIQYTGEQWRNGGNETQHSLIFSYQIGASDLISGIWIEVTSLSFTGPVATSTAGALDGNAIENRIILNSTINITLGVGQEIWFRWTDINDPGNDHGLAIDDFFFNPDTLTLPVELSSFSAIVLDNAVKLNWTTETEVSNYGFEIERTAPLNPPQGGTSGEWNTIGFVIGHGNSNSPKDYSFIDDLTLTPNLPAGRQGLNRTLQYRLKQIDTDGQFEYSKVVEVDLGSPTNFELSQNYPNPFNPSTTISFSLPQSGNVKLTVYNLLGELIAEPVNEFKEAGFHTINFSAIGGSAFGGNAYALPSGVYVYMIEANGFVQARKMTLVR